MENNLADYTPFGEEWENEVMKHSKPVITEMFRKVCLELQEKSVSIPASPDLAELKKEFDKDFPKFLFRQGEPEEESDLLYEPNEIWQWFSSKIESTLLALKNLQVRYLEVNEQVEQLQAELFKANETSEEHEKQRDFWNFEAQREHKEVEQLKAENEKLREQLNGKELKDLESVKEIINLNVEQARKDERARIVAQIQETAKKFYAINPLVLADEFIKAITADQPAQKSCEGCEHYFNIEENPFIICEFSCKYYSYYKSKEK